MVSVLSEEELVHLNKVADNFKKYDEDGKVIGDAELFFPLLGYPEMDFTFFPPNTLPLVKRILGGDDVPRLIGAFTVFYASSAVSAVNVLCPKRCGCACDRVQLPRVEWAGVWLRHGLAP